MSLEALISQINQYQSSLPPVELWQPKMRGEIAICIDSEGRWFYQESLFTRQNLVNLLSSVLTFEDNDFWLKTPVEQLKISVEDSPFIINGWHWLDDVENSTLVLKTNIGQKVLLSKNVEFVLKGDLLYVPVQRGLLAKVHRNVFYQWTEMAYEADIDSQPHMVIKSDGKLFSLGKLS